MVFTRSIMTLELPTWLELIRKHPDQRYVALFSRSMFSMVSILVFEYQFIRYDRIKEPRIDLHAPYMIQGMGME